MALDADDIKQISELVAASIKADREAADRASKTTSAKLIKEFEAKIAAATAKPADDADADADVDADPDVEPKVDPKFPVKQSQADKRLAARLARLEKEALDAKAAQAKAEAESKTNALLGSLREQLGEHGVKNAKAAIAVLHHAEQRLGFTEEGAPGVKFKRDGFEEVVPMALAIEEWLETDDGLAVLPPKNVQGTGTGNSGNSVVGKKGEIDLNELGNKLGEVIATARF